MDPWINPQDEIDAKARKEAEDAALDEPYSDDDIDGEFEYYNHLDQTLPGTQFVNLAFYRNLYSMNIPSGHYNLSCINQIKTLC